MTELEAANKALTLLGVANISSLGAPQQSARVMSGLLGFVRLAVLSEFAWTFALRLRALVPASATLPPGWLFAFEYPQDAAAVFQVYTTPGMQKTRYITESGVICANVPEANVEYTEMTPLDVWPLPVAEAFTARLASDAAVALTGSGQMSVSMMEKYNFLVRAAAVHSENHEHVSAPVASHYLDVRL